MIFPTAEQLGNDKLKEKNQDRYAITIATAKCARIVTDEYSRARTDAEGRISRKETDKPISALLKKDICEEKAIGVAIKRIQAGQFVAVLDSERISCAEAPEGSREVEVPDSDDFI